MGGGREGWGVSDVTFSLLLLILIFFHLFILKCCSIFFPPIHVYYLYHVHLLSPFRLRYFHPQLPCRFPRFFFTLYLSIHPFSVLYLSFCVCYSVLSLHVPFFPCSTCDYSVSLFWKPFVVIACGFRSNPNAASANDQTINFFKGAKWYVLRFALSLTTRSPAEKK